MHRIALLVALPLAAWAVDGPQKAVADWQSVFHVDKAKLVSAGTNPYFILTPGYQLVYQKGSETVTVTILNETKVVDQVDVRAVEDRETKNGQLVELTRDYYAIDPATRDVYYFGEDVDVYRDGKVVGHEGAWLSGAEGAKFGLMMPGSLRPGMRFYQEQAPGVAMDRVELVDAGERITTPAGTFENCVHFRESSPLEKGVTDHKWYAPGVGCVKDGDMPLVRIVKP